jgi:hypothetical protein
MEFVTFRKFNNPEHASNLAEILKEHNIPFEVSEDKNNLGSVYGENPLSHYYYIKLREEDFTKADALLGSISNDQLSAGQDHYLYSFTDQELFDILSKPDEWSAFDYQLSKKILKERGKDVTDEVLALLKKQRINELAKPEDSYKPWIYAGYIFALLGGLLGVFIGWHLTAYKKILPDGRRIYGYAESDRKHGRRILIIGSVMFMVYVVARLSQM